MHVFAAHAGPQVTKITLFTSQLTAKEAACAGVLTGSLVKCLILNLNPNDYSKPLWSLTASSKVKLPPGSPCNKAGN